MRAAILSIGDELTLGQQLDTNSAWLSARLAERSIITNEHRTVADDQKAIADAVKDLAARCDVLLMTGGLGPTADDLTREALCDALTPGEAPMIDPGAAAHLSEWFAKRARTMPAMNNKQALRPSTMRCLPNPHGTAPGLAGKLNHCHIFSMPGPPREMEPMFVSHVLPAIKRDDIGHQGDVVLTAMVQQFGMGESVAAQRLGDLMNRDRNPLVGTTVSESIVSARIRVQGPREQAQQALDQTIAQIESAWAPYAFGRDGATLADAVGSLLRRAKKKIVTAESCTGGWLGKVIVDRPKSSDHYLGGWITYSDQLKSQCLNVPAQIIKSHGAVSAQVAKAMAEGALIAAEADDSLAITGIAGPDGGTAEKPVGTVYIALAQKKSSSPTIAVRHFEFPGDRQTVRDRSVKSALQMLRFALMEVLDETPLLWEMPADVANRRLIEAESTGIR